MQNETGNIGTVTYTRNNLQNWQTEYNNILFRLPSYQSSIQGNKQLLNRLGLELQILVAKNSLPVKAKIKNLDAQIKVLTLPEEISSFTQQIAPHQEELMHLTPKLDHEEERLLTLKEEIFRLETLIKIDDHNQALQQLGEKLSKEGKELRIQRDALQVLESEASRLHYRIHNTQTELSALRSAQNWAALGWAMNPYNISYGSLNHDYDGYAQMVNDISQNDQINNLEIEIKNLHGKVDKIDSRINESQMDSNDLEQDIQSIEYDIAQHKMRRTHLLKQLSPILSCVPSRLNLEIELQEKHIQKTAHETVQLELEREITEHITAKDKLVSKVEQLDQSLLESIDIAKSLLKNSDLNDLNTQLEEQTSIQHELSIRENVLRDQINHHKKIIASNESEVTELDRRKNELLSNQFINLYFSNPQDLFKQLAERMGKKFAKFEQEYPGNQSYLVRISLIRAAEEMQSIRSNKKVETEVLYPDLINGLNNHAVIKKLYQLTGLLWQIHEEVKEADANFAAYVLSILGKEAFCAEESKEEYRSFQSGICKRKDMTESGLFIYERENYYKAGDEIKRTFIQLDEMYHNQNAKNKEFRDFIDQGKIVWEIINKAADAAINQADVNFDLKFHAYLLNQTNLLLQQPQDIPLRDRYKKLVLHIKDGQPLLCEKIGGAMIMFLGAATFAISAAIKFGSLGLSSPGTIPGMIVGGNLVAFGLGLFNRGREKALVKEMNKFSRVANKSAVSFWQQPKASTAKIERPTFENTSAQSDNFVLSPLYSTLK